METKLTNKEIQTNESDFTNIFKTVIIPQYPEAEKLLNYIKSSDFFTAPASTKYHSSCEGGLCLHSLLAYDRLLGEVDDYKKYLNNFSLEENLGTTQAGLALIGLCHDLCKIYTYEKYFTNTKEYSDYGKMSDNVGAFDWVQKESYKYNEQFSLGHGAKSLYLIMKYVPNLSVSEASAIYYHMGGIDNIQDKNSTSAFIKHPLSLLLHIADIKATFFDETI